MSYGYVENGEVVKIQSNLPKSWKNISGFNNLTDEQVKSYGWYVIIVDDTPLKEYEKKVSTNIVFDSENEFILESYNIETLSLEDYKIQKIKRLKSEIEQRTYGDYPVYKQLSAALGNYDSVETKVIKDGVKAAKDLVDAKEILILEAVSLEEVEMVTW